MLLGKGTRILLMKASTLCCLRDPSQDLNLRKQLPPIRTKAKEAKSGKSIR